MEEKSAPASWRAFRVVVDYTEAEIAAYRRIAGRVSSYQKPAYAGWGVYGTGGVLGLLCGWLAYAGGAVEAKDGGIVVVLAIASFCAGVWAPSAWTARFRRKSESDLLRRMFEASQGTVLFFGPAGISMRATATRAYHAHSAFRSVTVEDGLILFLIPPEISIPPVLTIPARLLNGEQQEAIAARWSRRASAGGMAVASHPQGPEATAERRTTT
ncbi:MAG TPA: hypothetical protein VD840_09680 [Sinorhizobium sp.]|nr:hypothetical protein [Sinorhizobium sp.]